MELKKKKIVIAPDSFKESMTAQQAAVAIAKGVKSVFQDKLDLELIPMADGGEGTIQSLADALDGTTHSKKVTGPLGNSVIANYAISGDKTTAIIEMAEASGIALVPSEIRNPLKTTTHGTGQLIQAALDHNVEKIILGIGGSATNDGGAGMVEALGGKLLNSEGNSIPSGGGSLIDLDDIDLSNLDKRLQDVQIIVACDVDNPLLGEYGASAIYGPQKGADKKMASDLDSALSNYHDVLERVTKKSVKDIPGAGAAGGLGAGLLAFLHAKLEPGVEIVLKETNFYERVVDADLVLTGEGKIDGQTIYGKTPIGVAKATKRFNIPVIALSGTLGTDYEKVYNHGIDAAFSIVQGPCDLEDALKNGPNYLEGLARNVAKLLVIH